MKSFFMRKCAVGSSKSPHRDAMRLDGKWALIVAAITAVLITPAAAADMPMPVKAPVAPIVWDWNEVYFGVHIGQADGSTSWCTNFFAVNCATTQTDRINQVLRGASIGGQFGYRWQATSNIVLGAEAMLDGMAINKTSPSNLDPNGTRYSAFNNIVSTTGQLGFAWDRVLTYGKGGWAMTRVNFDAQDTVSGADLSTPQWKWEQGWTAGAGIEYLLWTHMSIGLEYNYYQFDISSFNNLTANTGAVVGCSFCNFGRSSVQTVVARMNVKLWPWGP
jgi:outer membrane immunogenic protein